MAKRAHKILIIEDEQFINDLYRHKLTQENYEVISAFDAQDGWQMFLKEKPDLVLLDLILPKGNGFEILQKAKTSPETSSVPIIILSNLGQPEDAQRALDLGALGYLIKADFTPTEVVKKINEVFAKKT